MKNNKTSEYISDTSKDYALYTCEVRAIPKVTDGLKDGQRKALWVLRNRAEQIKTMAAGSLTVYEGLYVHGDTSINDTISRISAPYLNNICFLDGIGAFGSKLSPDSFGAPRYTHVKRAKSAQDIMFTDLDIVPLMENYDGSNFSAATFLPIIPTVLLNGVSGIAVGWSTDILPHKLSDLVDGCLNILDNKKVKKLKPYFNNYDITIENIEDNSWSIKGKVKIEDSVTIAIKELPPGMKIEKFREFLDQLEEENKIKDYVDKSTKHVDVKVKLSREFLRGKTEDELVDFFKLRVRSTERMVVIGFNNKMKVYETHHDLFQDFIEWRLTWYVKRYQNLLKLTKEELNFSKAIKECFDKKFTDELLGFNNKKEVTEWVELTTKKFKIDENQISKLVNMPSFKWTKESYQEIIAEIKRLQDLEKEYVDILASPIKIKDIYKKELLDLRKKYV